MSYNDEERVSPFRSRGFIFGAIMLGLIAAAATIAVVVSLVAPGTPTERPAASTSSSPAPTASPAGEGSVCGLDDVELDGTVKAAPETEWSFVGRVAVPSSADAGPGVIEADGFRYCYSRTPEGALFAAANFVALTTIPELGASTAKTLVADGPGREAAMRNAATVSSSTNFSVQIAGFKVLEYDEANARIDTAILITDGTLASYVVDLIWEEGDWKAVFTSAGEPAQKPIAIQSLGGYLPWSS